jgi:hypothetical protein
VILAIDSLQHQHGVAQHPKERRSQAWLHPARIDPAMDLDLSSNEIRAPRPKTEQRWLWRSAAFDPVNIPRFDGKRGVATPHSGCRPRAVRAE